MGSAYLDPLSTEFSKNINRPQSARSTLMNDNIPSSIEFDAKKYKDYDRGNGATSYLIDGNAFINFLRRQTSKTMARSKSGLVGYVNVSVSDQIAECTPWKLHRIFITSVSNRMGIKECTKNMQLLKQNEALTETLRDKSDQIDAYRAQISQIKQQLAEQKKEINKKTKSTRYLK